ncbi:MAG: trimeric autotransporter adhesin [Acidimicrobiaceae bacterium]
MLTNPRRSGGPRRSRAALAVGALVAALVVPLAALEPAAAAPGDITTVAGGGGGGLGDGGPATAAKLAFPWGLARSGGTLYVSDNGLSANGPSPLGNRLRAVDASGVISTVMGGVEPPIGDGQKATVAALSNPNDVAFDSAGNLYIADAGHHLVRRVDSGGTITTVAGNGQSGVTGDGGPATSAAVGFPTSVVVDSVGNLYVADGVNGVVRRVDALTHVITTVAGGGSPADGLGDGGPATSASLTPRGLALAPGGSLLIADIGHMRIRKVDLATGLIKTVAGNGGTDPAVEGAKATKTTAPFPEGIFVDQAGNIYFSSVVVNRVYRIDQATKTISTVAGGGAPADQIGDGLPATQSSLDFPLDVAVNAAGDVFITDANHSRIRRVDHATQVITTVGGTGVPGFNGDGLPGPQTQFAHPAFLTVDAAGNAFVSDDNASRVRRIDATTGIVTTVAGGGVGDGGPAAQASLAEPRDLATATDGNILIADCGDHRVRKYDVATRMVTTVVGGGQPVGAVGDGLGATDAELLCPSGIFVAAAGTGAPPGTMFIADAGQNRVRRVAPNGVVTTVAGTGVAGFNGDGRAATRAQLSGPSDVALDAAGNVYISDTGNHRVRKVDVSTGQISTVAGNGKLGVGDSGVPGTSTPMTAPLGLLPDGSGNLLIADASFPRIARLDLSTGVITTVAGTGVPGFSGDGGPATEANLDLPTEMVLDSAGNLLLTDRANHRVRRVESGSPAPPPVTGCGAVITANTTLTADVGPCPGDGIIIGADNITLDLAGHQVSGAGRGDGSHVGVLISHHTGVTVTGNSTSSARKGVVRDFNAGVVVIGGSANTITNLGLRRNQGRDTDALYGDGVAVFFSARNRIVGNEVINNGPYDGIALLGFGSDANTIQGNDVEGTSNGGSQGVGIGLGIVLNPFFSFSLPREVSIYDNQILDNTVKSNDNAGISTLSNINGVIRGNTVDDNGHGGDFPFPGNGIGVQFLQNAQAITRVLVSFNEVHGNGNAGIVVGSEGNRIQNNDASHNDGAFGDADLTDLNENCDSNTWSANTYSTASPDCTTAGGQQVDAAGARRAAVARTVPASGSMLVGSRPVPPGA